MIHDLAEFHVLLFVLRVKKKMHHTPSIAQIQSRPLDLQDKSRPLIFIFNHARWID
jgi:hypothetical protein